MSRAVGTLPAGSRVTDYISLGVIAKTFPLDTVQSVLRDTGRSSQRRRALPAPVVVYYVIALALYMQSSYREVLRCLLEGVQWLAGPSRALEVAGKSGISQARTRLGWEPLRRLHGAVVKPIADRASKGAWYGRWRLVSLDGSTLDVADEASTRLDIGLIHPYEAELDLRIANGEQILFLGGRKIRSASCWWDPAYGGTERRDASAVACVFTDVDGHHFIHDVRYLRHDRAPDGVDEATAQCRQVLEFAKRNLLTAVTVEKNGIGMFLPGLLNSVLRESGIAVLKRHNHDQKAARILKAFDARLAARIVHAHRDVLAGPFGAEIQSWRPVEGRRAGQDDALDAVAGCLEAEPVIVRKTAPHRPPRTNWRGTAGIHRVTMA